MNENTPITPDPGQPVPGAPTPEAPTPEELTRQKAEAERLAYEEQLRQERLELLRLKTGVIEESEMIREEHEEKPHYTIPQRIGNFFYHNKWWMGLACFFVFVIGFLTWQLLTAVKPDLIVLLLVDDDALNAFCNASISEVFGQYVDDVNGDGRVVVDVYYIPASQEAADVSGMTGNTEKLFAEFQIGEACLVISDEGADQFIVPEHLLTDLEPDLGQYAEVEGVRFKLSGTQFAQDIGWVDAPLDDDIYLGIRSVRKTLDSEEYMQAVYDVSYPVLQKFVEHYGTVLEEEQGTE